MNANDRVVNLEQVGKVIQEAKVLARTYRQLMGRPLGITGEVAEFEAARLLGLRLCEARQAGYDALDLNTTPARRIQIKGRCVLDSAKPGQRIGSIKLEHEWDTVVLVLLDQDFEPLQLFEAQRRDIAAALLAPGSKSRNERGSLGISKFRSIARCVWKRT